MSIKELAKKLNRSAPTVRKRLDYMREQGLLYETILTNIGIVEKGFVINFVLELPEMTNNLQIEIEKEMRTSYEDSFVVSWKVVDKPIIFLTFQVNSAVEAQEILGRIVSMFPDYLSIRQAISGSWKYYKDFRDKILEERS
ncbi:MAG: hypothetical protein ACW99X_08035 [Candidatus Thorarchaeota archaeon]